MSFASNLKKIREELGFSPLQASLRLCMSYQQYHALEQGVRSPNLKTIERIAKAFGISKARLIEDDE